MKKVAVFGTGYLGIIKLISAINMHNPTYDLIGFINDFDEFSNASFLNIPVIGTRKIIPDLLKENVVFYNNINHVENKKQAITKLLKEQNCQLPSFIHPSIDMQYVTYGEGCLFSDGCFFDTNVTIGSHVTVYPGSIFSHDATIGDFSYFSPRSVIGGNSVVKSNCYLGIGSTIMSGVTVGENSVVGAGSTVTSNVPPNSLVYGSPAKFVKSIDRNIFRGKAM